MAEYIVSCCSTADIPKEQFLERDIKYLCFHYQLDGVDYPDDLGDTIPFKEFYSRLVNGSDSTTSQVNISEYLAFFEPFLQEGKDIIHICLSSGISGSYNSAVNAANIARERYPDRKIYIIDSLAASAGFGLLADTMADLRDSGMSIDELKDWVEENKLRINHWFFSTDLTFFVKGGRISKGAALFGGILNICPLMNVSFEGRLIPRENIRGKKACIKRTVKKMLELADNGAAYDGKCFISHSDDEEDAKLLAEGIEEAFPALKDKIKISYIGTTIGSHTGPGTVALFFYGKKRED